MQNRCNSIANALELSFVFSVSHKYDRYGICYVFTWCPMLPTFGVFLLMTKTQGYMVAFCVVMWDDCLMSCMICVCMFDKHHTLLKRGNQLTVLSVVCDGVHCSADQQWNRQTRTYSFELRWHHNEHDGISNPQPHECWLSRLFRRRWKKTSKFPVTGLCEGNIRRTGELPTQRARNAENVSIWWHHHGLLTTATWELAKFHMN